MDSGAIRRLAVISASPVGPRAEQPVALRLLVAPILDRFFGGVYDDLRRMETVLDRRSDLAWACLRPPRLRDRPARGAYRLGLRPLPRSRSLTYPDLATALLDCADGTEPQTGMWYVAGSDGPQSIRRMWLGWPASRYHRPGHHRTRRRP